MGNCPIPVAEHSWPIYVLGGLFDFLVFMEVIFCVEISNRTKDRGWIKDQGSRIKAQGSRTEDRGPRTEDRGPRTEDRGPWTEDQGPRIED